MTEHRPRPARALYHAASLTAIGVAAASFGSDLFDVRAVVILVAAAALIFGGLGMRVHSSGRASTSSAQSMHAAVAILVLYLVGPSIAVLAGLLASVVYDLSRGRTPTHLLGNLPARVVPIAVAGSTWIHLGGGSVATISLPDDYLPLAGSALVFALVNELCFLWDTLSTPATDRFVPRLRGELQRLPSNLVTTGLECLVGAGVAALCIDNPWAAPVVLPMAASMYLALERGNRVQELTERALDTFATIVDERDRYTFEHSDRVCEYAMSIGRRLGLSERRLEGLYWTSRLHDLGKVAVDNSILNKPGRLDDEEFAVMKSHPEVSARILASFSFGEYDAEVVRCHHERYDGKGYLCRSRDDVPYESFVIAVADAFDAMTSTRPYRDALTHQEAFEEIARGTGTHFHPEPAYAFLALMGYDFEHDLARLAEDISGSDARHIASVARRYRADFGDDIREVA